MERQQEMDLKVRVEKLTGEDGHYFYGYYDNPAWSGDDRYHLCHKTAFWNRLQEETDEAGLGMIDMLTKSYIPLAQTHAWNFQQGAMLQWHPLAPNDEIIFNTRSGGEFQGVVMNVHTKEQRLLSRPVVNVDPTGKYALSVNFSRMFDFRPGYGYAGIRDPFYDNPYPEEDGVYRIELATGKNELVLSLADIWHFTKDAFAGTPQKLMINHINFNTDGSRFLLLARNFPQAGGHWKTAVLTANSDGSDLFLLSDYNHASHYHWRDPQHVVIYSRGAEGSTRGSQLYVLKDKTYEVNSIDEPFFREDGHCSYSPDRQLLLYDSYPDNQSYRHLYVYDLAGRKGIKLGSFYSDPGAKGDHRCDLHPRWNRAGTGISFDSTHEGRRHMYFADISGVFK
ncbi:hypothetical protein [Paenibacillus thalictri]|uniref:Oligogalacturonate lyase domain-containing protein n=1 Tax=Paenibacillus thalictri TaxID=2527873 RepID=A0A4Q9DN96_9BACL|nr:hypothetical protein [Paenibacillus thalictri]TBL75334.1 hypothetical protein EYB31_23280 [Paenibacillus thalictri]